MMVPRTYRYNATPTLRDLREKDALQRRRKSASPKPEAKIAVRPASPVRTTTEPPRAPTPPVDVPTPERSRTAGPKTLPTMQRGTKGGSRSSKRASAHDPNALPPAVAALLAVTQIPRPRPNQFRRRPAASRNISIDELVNEWKSEDGLSSNLSSSPTLSMLLEDQDDEERSSAQDGNTEEDYLLARSTSAESMPSLEDDDRSIMSNGSLPTPESMRSRKSTSNLKKDKARSLPTAVDCATSHPLAHRDFEDEDDTDDGLVLAPPSSSRSTTPKPKSSFKSNLTTSFQALKNAFSSFSINPTPQPQRSMSSQFTDDMLWSHPFLFPRFSSEIRPAAVHGTPTEAQRRYLNPIPLIFDDVETPYQLALHADFLAEPVEGAPTIQMQTYSRIKRKYTARRVANEEGPSETSEAGRALLGGGGVKQREVRENSDFLRVVVLEMNMRKLGKLKDGRARFWLPPRQGSPSAEKSGRVPLRWVGESAY